MSNTFCAHQGPPDACEVCLKFGKFMEETAGLIEHRDNIREALGLTAKSIETTGQNELDAISELKAQLKEAQDFSYALAHPIKSPCGHCSSHAVSEDGGKSIRCLDCTLTKETEKKDLAYAVVKAGLRWQKEREIPGSAEHDEAEDELENALNQLQEVMGDTL